MLTACLHGAVCHIYYLAGPSDSRVIGPSFQKKWLCTEKADDLPEVTRLPGALSQDPLPCSVIQMLDEPDAPSRSWAVASWVLSPLWGSPALLPRSTSASSRTSLQPSRLSFSHHRCFLSDRIVCIGTEPALARATRAFHIAESGGLFSLSLRHS